MTENVIIKDFSLPSEQDLGTQVENNSVIKKLLENSKAAIMGAVELHNKPIFPYRYEIAVILTINAWELAMKAYLMTFKKEVKIFDGDWSKEFLKCIGSIMSDLGKDFLPQKESIELLYKYRCDVIHFYGEGIELILYSLLRPNILHFADFLLKHFKIDLAGEANLIILPVGFKRFVSPIDFLSEHSSEGCPPVKEFINSIRNAAKTLEENGFEDGLLINYNMAVESVNRVKNADIIAGIVKDGYDSTLAVNKSITISGFTNDPNAPKVQIDEDSLFKTTYVITAKNFINRIKEAVPTFKATNTNMKLINEKIKQDANCFRAKCLDAIPTSKSIKKGFYSEAGVEKAISIFTIVTE